MTTNSPTPGTPQTATKAVLAGVGAFFATFIVSLSTATLGRDDIDSLGTGAWLLVVLGSLAATIVSGGFAYQVKNKPL